MISARRGTTSTFLHKKVKTKVESEQLIYKFKATKRNSFSDLVDHLSDKKIRWSSFHGIGDYVAGKQENQ